MVCLSNEHTRCWPSVPSFTMFPTGWVRLNVRLGWTWVQCNFQTFRAPEVWWVSGRECRWLLCKELDILRSWEFNGLLFREYQNVPSLILLHWKVHSIKLAISILLAHAHSVKYNYFWFTGIIILNILKKH